MEGTKNDHFGKKKKEKKMDWKEQKMTIFGIKKKKEWKVPKMTILVKKKKSWEWKVKHCHIGEKTKQKKIPGVKVKKLPFWEEKESTWNRRTCKRQMVDFENQ